MTPCGNAKKELLNPYPCAEEVKTHFLRIAITPQGDEKTKTMKKTIFNRLITIGVCAAFSVAALAASVPGQSEEKDSPKVTILPVRDVATGEKIPAAGATMEPTE